MRLKLFRASTVTEAMARVRDELGADALILGTRRVDNGVEVTAALESAEPPPPLPDPARLAALTFHAVPTSLQGSLACGPLHDTLSRTFLFTSLPIGIGDRPLLIIGPPGAGKTLTVARLATRLVMSGTMPLVVTADGRRAGAAEQLAAFTRLLGLNLIVANHPVTLARALTRRQDGAPVLIDSAGADPYDPVELEELRALAAASNAAIALVMPAGLDPAEAFDLASAFAETGASFLIVTKLDLARRFGGLLAAASLGLPFTEAGIGPNAADGMVPLTPETLAARLMQTGNTAHGR